MRRATSRSASTSRPESISSRIANFGLEHRELQRLGALLLAAGELDVDARARGTASPTPRRVGLGRDAIASPSASRPWPRSAAARKSSSAHAGHLDRVLQREEQAARGALAAWAGRAARRRRCVTEPAGDLVVAAAHEHVRQRRLARPVRAHERVHLARRAPRGRRRAGSPCRRPTRAGPTIAQHAHGRRHHHVVAVDPDVVDGHRLGGGQGLRLAGLERERGAVLRALDLALVLPHVALGERVVGVGARVADHVPVVVDAHDAQAVAVDVEARVRCPARRRRPCRPARQALALAIASRCSIFSITLRRSGATSDGSGSRSNTSSKNPSTMSRSASSGGTPRVSR